MTHNHWDLVFLFLFLVALGLAVVWTIEYFFPTDYELSTANDYEDEGHFAEEISDPWQRIEAQDAEIIRLYAIIENLKEDIYLLRNIRHSEPQNAESRLGVKHTEGLGDSTAQEVTGDCA